MRHICEKTGMCAYLRKGDCEKKVKMLYCEKDKNRKTGKFLRQKEHSEWNLGN